MSGRSVLTLLVGGVLGMMLGSSWGGDAPRGSGLAGSQPEPDLDPRGGLSVPAEAEDAAGTSGSAVADASAAAEEAPEVVEPAPLVTDTLAAHALELYGATRHALGHPAGEPELEALPTRFEESVLDLPARLARQDVRVIEEREARDARLLALREAAAVGPYVEALRDGDAPAEYGVEGVLFDALVANRGSEAVVDGDAFADGEAPVTEGLVLRFGPGLHTLDEARLRGPEGASFPRDVTLAGEGMDVTLLRLGDLSIRGDVERLTLRDLTVDCGDDGLFDLRTGALGLRAERVRFVRFDAGHGGSVLFAARGVVLDLRDCEVLGGFGRAPGLGDLVRGEPAQGRFTNVRFELLDPGFRALDAAVFTNCRFDRILAADQAAPGHLVFRGCQFGEPLPNGYSLSDLRRELAELFPELD